MTSAALAAANLSSPLISDVVAKYMTIAVAVLAAVMFVCSVFDPRFQNAVSALNAERRAQALKLGWRARLFGWGLPGGDRLLLAVGIVLIVEAWASSNIVHHFSAASLSFAAFFLTAMTSIGLMVRGYPSDQFKRPFT
jgi:hypothetical protein